MNRMGWIAAAAAAGAITAADRYYFPPICGFAMRFLLMDNAWMRVNNQRALLSTRDTLN